MSKTFKFTLATVLLAVSAISAVDTASATTWNRFVQQRIVGHYINGQHYYPSMWRPGQTGAPSTASVTPAPGKNCGGGWYLGSDGTCYPNIH